VSCLQSLFNISGHPGTRTSRLVELINKCAPHIGEVQVANVPDSAQRSRWRVCHLQADNECGRPPSVPSGPYEMENAAYRRRYTTGCASLVGLAVDAAIRLATTGPHLNEA
jgi:hypothetical protein